jgi:DNA-binding transcriptional LysR family regulator
MARNRLRPYFRHGLLPQLIAFEACLRLGGVTRAAEELAVAQPTVSGLLRKLSDTIGAPVLKTRGGRVELTDAGRDVAGRATELLNADGFGLTALAEDEQERVTELLRTLRQEAGDFE